MCNFSGIISRVQLLHKPDNYALLVDVLGWAPGEHLVFHIGGR